MQCGLSDNIQIYRTNKKVGEGEKEMEKRLSWIIASSVIAGGQIIPFEVEKSSSRSRRIFIPQR